ncbi:hypothetical protein L0F63_006080 [Massospora cicadina]|nr:hypothetical protein L0F63_006080 [Massospora cicadina]
MTSISQSTDGCVLGYFNTLELGPAATVLDPGLVDKLTTHLKFTGAKGKDGQSRLYVATDSSPARVALVSLGAKPKDPLVLAKRARFANGSGVKLLKSVGAVNVAIDNSFGNHNAAEGALLGLYSYNLSKKLNAKALGDEKAYEIKADERVKASPLFQKSFTAEIGEGFNWGTGVIYAEAQNRARFWMDSPANLMTPTIFTSHVKDLASKLPNLDVHIRDRDWIREMKMGAFLSVTRGSAEEPRLLELHYSGAGAQTKPLAFVGKGITFDSGGISIKPSANMHHMKADMGGAATVAAAILAIAELKLPINVKAVIALCENMPSSTATKPGDVVTAMNGKTIEVLNTDAEGRMVLSDALHYLTTTYKPHTVMTVATLTGAMAVSLGDVYTGAFCSNKSLWDDLQKAGRVTGDPFWRMPFHASYRELMTQSNVADLANVGVKNAGGSCSAAAFLREFIPRKSEPPIEPLDMNEDDTLQTRYAHLDIAGVMESPGDSGYHVKGMSGRPARSFIELARQLSLKDLSE